MPDTYAVTEDRKKQFAAAYLLDRIDRGLRIPLLLEGDQKDLEPVLEFMMMKRYVAIEDNRRYAIAPAGRKLLEGFTRRYRDFLLNFDIYCAVDLGEGAFAFERFFDFETDDEWERYLARENWDDLRIAVAEFKGLDPVEIVFMSHLNEGQFGEGTTGWEFDLLLGTVWDGISEICRTALHVPDLGYTADDGEQVGGESVIRDVITQGARLNRELKEREREMAAEQGGGEESEAPTDEEMVTVVEYEEPRYVYPAWHWGIWL